MSPEGLTNAPHHGDVELAGLSDEDVRRRRADGLGNRVDEPSSRSTSGIIRANTLTRFNATISALVAVVLVFGEPIDAAFGLVMVVNATIGIVQELRAKRSLDSLRVLLTPSIVVVRNNAELRVEPADLVQGDIIRLHPGDQIPVDGTVRVSEGLEVDESSLTGESEPVPKAVGDEILSGSFVVAGTATVVATGVGAEAWAHKLTQEAKQFELSRSELRVGVDQLLKVSAWILPPLAALLFWSQLRSDADPADGVIAAVAGVVALVPQGLVLLVSMAMAVAVVRLGKQNVVVQELPAVEGLARVDVLCVDKTGTLTTGNLMVDHVEAIGIEPSVLYTGLGALGRIDAARSTTLDAIRAWLPDDGPSWQAEHVVPFSSVWKWSGAVFVDQGTWVLGAPEVLLEATVGEEREELARKLETLTDRALRVLMVGHSESADHQGNELPPGLKPVGLVALFEEIRPDAAQTLEYFRRQNVAVKIISGDNSRTVAAVAATLGLDPDGRELDLRTVTSIGELSTDTVVFGRVLPEQKRDLVKHLQEAGHTVAMTGDGVNDIPALKAADIGIAMNTATPATKATAQLVLLDGRFDRLPGVVAEGRRVIANMERVSSLFVTKTVYAALLALVFGVLGTTFPFLPRHLTVVATITIGVPAFFMSFRSADEPCVPGYLRRVVLFAVPAGLAAALATMGVFWLSRSSVGSATLAESRTAATISLTIAGLWVLFRLARPLSRIERLMILALLIGFAATVAWPPTADLYAFVLPSIGVMAMTGVVLLVMMGSLQFGLDLAERTFSQGREPHDEPPEGGALGPGTVGRR